MRIYEYKRVDDGRTFIEVLGILAAVAILLALYLASLPKQWHRAPGIQCVNNLKQIGLATRVWEGDNNDKYPTAVSATNGGAMEYITGPNAWKNYQVMSNELSTPKVLLCPAETDPHRFLATNFAYLNNSNISFFVGVDANETITNAILSGDRNITNGMPLKNALLELTTNHPAGWNSEMHRAKGNLILADGSARQSISNVELQNAIANSGFATNRLQYLSSRHNLMKLAPGKRSSSGMTLIEVVLIVGVLMVLAALVLIPAISRARGRPPRIQCANNLKEIGLSFQIWESDNGDYYPMFISQTNGGTMEFNSGPNAWRHFQVLSDELIEPKLLICPADADRNRAVATDFNLLSNSNLSYFVGMASNELSARMILSGDHNINNGAAIKDGVLELTKKRHANWTRKMHGNVGNILLADGSVDQVDNVGLRGTVACTGVAENLIQMPVLGP